MSPAASSTAPAPVVVITGASSGIGRAAAIAFARRGPVHLLLTARRLDALEETATLARAAADAPDALVVELIPADLSDATGAEQLADALLAARDRIDVLVNNAGAGTDRPFEEDGAIEDADRILTLNLRAPIALTQRLLPALQRSRGTVVNVASVAGLVGTPDSPVYSTSKWGLVGFSEALHARLAGTGVRVHAVLPGPVPTPGWPHEELSSLPIIGRFVTCDADTIARAIVRATEPRGRPIAIHPRLYRIVPTLRAACPWLVRRMLRRTRGHGSAPRIDAAVTPPTTETST